MSDSDLIALSDRLREFAAARDWEKFHTPKNLASALSVEASELLEIFQWLTPEESSAVMADDKNRAAVLDEMADVLIYLVRMADVLDVDLVVAANAKVSRNETRFPLGK
jgi:NTP pyrophosphatase (non-canonical NTP hydrolase)